jgi:molybdate transport system regulatory protein
VKRTASRFSFRIELPRGRLGHGKIELLEHVARTGSLAAAARAMNMSYRRAWELLTITNQMFDDAVATTHPGRNITGATEVTAFGLRLITNYRRLEQRLAKAACTMLEQLGRPARSARRPRPSAQKTSKRAPKRAHRTGG